MSALLQKFEHNQVFSESEGWILFRVAAIAEACGWTALIFGIAWAHFGWPGNEIPVQIAGKVHGMLFLGYALASIGLYPTLRWSRKRALVALMASVPPYGSLVFEQWAAHMRATSQFKIYSRCALFMSLVEAG